MEHTIVKPYIGDIDPDELPDHRPRTIEDVADFLPAEHYKIVVVAHVPNDVGTNRASFEAWWDLSTLAVHTDSLGIDSTGNIIRYRSESELKKIVEDERNNYLSGRALYAWWIKGETDFLVYEVDEANMYAHKEGLPKLVEAD